MQSELPCNPPFKTPKNEGEKCVSGFVRAGKEDGLGLCGDLGNLSTVKPMTFV